MLTMAEFASDEIIAARDTVKAYARIEQSAEDSLISGFCRTVLELCEAFCGRVTLAREAVEILPASGEWRRLGAQPVRAIGTVEGLPADGAAFTLSTDAYAIDIDTKGVGWVRVSRPGAAGRVRVTYEAGLTAAWEALPDPIQQGAIRLAVHLYTHRDDSREGAPPAAVAALWRPWRRVKL